MRATFIRKESTAKQTTTFWFQPERPVRYSAGQFTELYLPHNNVDERRDKHWFTLSSSPTDPLLSITTKFAEDRSSTFKQTLQKLQPGATVHMASPMGDFILPKDRSIPLLFVAAGIGCTPFHSIIKYLQDTGETRDITLLQGVHSLEYVAFRKTFEKLQANFQLVVEHPGADWKGATGRITTQKILESLTNPQKQHIYISGPEPMVETLTKELGDSGFPKRHIRTDYFPGYTTL